MVDLSESNGERIDLVVATRDPPMLARVPLMSGVAVSSPPPPLKKFDRPKSVAKADAVEVSGEGGGEDGV